MATIKSFSDLQQSKKLAEILPLESADQIWERFVIAGANLDVPDELQYKHSGNIPSSYYNGIPCWSLSALLDVLPTIDDEFEPQLHRSSDKYICTYEGKEDSSGLWRVADNPIDACVDMIIKLYEQNLL